MGSIMEMLEDDYNKLVEELDRLKTERDTAPICCKCGTRIYGDDEHHKLKSDLAAAVEIITGCIGSLEYVDRNHKNVTGYGVREQRIAEANSFLARMEVK
jgi:hypothetical protein